MVGCKLCGKEVEEDLCEECLEKLSSTKCIFCGEPLIDLEVEEGFFRHKCGMRFSIEFLGLALELGLEEALKLVCDEYDCDGELEECASTCERLREFVASSPSKIRPILEPVLKDSGMYVEYGWKTCLVKDDGGLLVVLIDQHNPAYLSEGPSSIVVEGPDKATIIGSKPTERQVELLGPLEEALKQHGYVDLLKVFVELPGEMGTVEAP
ncbi:MAG: hypothetical protein DRJ98_04150 [Thermoprotei archaeon]|nr:MAG: hypothetical protein DRJ98_04150 [Thermoprotei archaeon]RLF17350.1 MAG: hypothetical protein DRN06_03970 [Thermoprotei archaeon]